MSNGLREKVKDTNLGYKGGRPADFELGVDSGLHNTTSVNGDPAFSSYKSPVIRQQKPTRLAPKTPPRGTPAKYLDNPPT